MIGASKKLLQGTAGNAGGGAGLDITDVFSTYLYEGNGYPNTNRNNISNGIDLAGEGGMVWIKSRTDAYSHKIYDTERGVYKGLMSDSTAAQNNDSYRLTSFDSDGFEVWFDYFVNKGGSDYTSWTFRKAPKFFDVVSITATSNQTVINHNLGSVPGCVIIKGTDITSDWLVYHKDVGSSAYLQLNTTNASAAYTDWCIATDSTVTVKVGAMSAGSTYVAYIFAHNNSDGEFGPDADQDIIKCGSYTGVYAGAEVNLGWQPQWILFKSASSTGDWSIFDAMRGIVTGGLSGDGDAALFPNTSGAENVNTWGVDLTATGFITYGNNVAATNDMIYMAIRRGPLAPPEAGTEVFAVDEGDGVGAVSAYTSGFPVDFAIDRTATSISPNYVATRLLQGTRLQTDGTNAEASESAYYFDYMEGWRKFARAAGNYSWMWKRAPSFFDVVAYTGTGVARTVSHNLGVAPEMIWVKNRTSSDSWYVWHSSFSATEGIILDLSNGKQTGRVWWNSTLPTSSVFTVERYGGYGASGNNYIAYLFASLAGVSKVGSYTGNGSSQTIDCGFTSGARFILIKRTDSTGDWYVWDTTRGIVAGNDPHLSLNTTAAQVTTDDSIDPDSSGFIVNQVSATNINVSSATYIYYAVA